MLARSVVDEIDRLLKAGQLSRRKIAERTGVSRGTVYAISTGRRALFGKPVDPDSLECDPHFPAARCPKCGFLVHRPCLVCRARAYRELRKYSQAMRPERPLSPGGQRRPPIRRRRRACRARVA